MLAHGVGSASGTFGAAEAPGPAGFSWLLALGQILFLALLTVLLLPGRRARRRQQRRRGGWMDFEAGAYLSPAPGLSTAGNVHRQLVESPAAMVDPYGPFWYLEVARATKRVTGHRGRSGGARVWQLGGQCDFDALAAGSGLIPNEAFDSGLLDLRVTVDRRGRIIYVFVQAPARAARRCSRCSTSARLPPEPSGRCRPRVKPSRLCPGIVACRATDSWRPRLAFAPRGGAPPLRPRCPATDEGRAPAPGPLLFRTLRMRQCPATSAARLRPSE